jgi:hypothetical protein
MVVRLSVLHADHCLPPGRFLVLISVKRLSQLQGHSAAGRVRSIEKYSDLIGMEPVTVRLGVPDKSGALTWRSQYQEKISVAEFIVLQI